MSLSEAAVDKALGRTVVVELIAALLSPKAASSARRCASIVFKSMVRLRVLPSDNTTDGALSVTWRSTGVTIPSWSVSVPCSASVCLSSAFSVVVIAVAT